MIVLVIQPADLIRPEFRIFIEQAGETKDVRPGDSAAPLFDRMSARSAADRVSDAPSRTHWVPAPTAYDRVDDRYAAD